MKQPKPWFRASKSAWYVELCGKQVRIGAHPDGAPPPNKSAAGWNAPKPILDAFYKLMAADPARLPPPAELLAAQVCDLFLDDAVGRVGRKDISPDTVENYRHFLRSFCRHAGRVRAAELIPLHVTAWLNAHPGWKASRRHATIAVKAAFGWAAKQGLLPRSPLAGLAVPPPNRRARVLSREELDQILAAVRDREFREFLRAMLETGCRPSEVARVTAANVDLALGVWVLPEHKTAKKTRKERVVYLTPGMVELSRELALRHPDGPLFRGPRGKAAFTRQNIRCRFRRLRKKLPHLKHFVCYNVRHTFATRALVNGVGVAQVAELLGHTSTEMVSKTYGHLAEQVGHLREAARRAVS